MKKVLKIIGVLVLVGIILFTSLMLYLSRSRDIDFSEFYPNKFTFCDKSISAENIAYRNIEKWLQVNHDGWSSSPVSFVKGAVFDSEGFNVNILSDAVVINYKNALNESTQVVHSKLKSELNFKCKYEIEAK